MTTYRVFDPLTGRTFRTDDADEASEHSRAGKRVTAAIGGSW